nr:M6 family metalloprotease domain-containing protein [Salsipaludibacter albus]
MTEPAGAAPAAPGVREFQQPDGSTIRLEAWGDEYVSGYDTLDGHAVFRERTDAPWYYAVRAPDGSLTASDALVGRDAPPVAAGLRPAPRVVDSARAFTEGAPSITASASADAPPWAGPDTDILFIAVEFSDLGCTFSDTTFQGILGGGSATGPGNLEDYYREISYGDLELDVTVEGGAGGCYTLPDSRATYNSGSKDHFDLMNEAVDLADGDVDFSQYDNDGDGVIDALGIIYAGGGTHDGCFADNGAAGSGDDNLWPKSRNQTYATDDGVDTFNFIINSEITRATDGVCDEAQSIGLFAHELGHSLGLPDLYDSDNSSAGVGSWSAMASQYLTTTVLADTPPHFDPWSKWILGWISPDDKTGFSGNGAIDQVEDNGYVIQLLDNPDGPEEGGTGEYFLVENRQQVGFDAQLQGCGLLIWHMEESQTNNENEGHTTGSHRLVDIEEADGLDHLDGTDQGADDGDPFPGSSDNREFRGATYPTSNLYDGSPSGVSISAISDCAPSMTANFGNPVAELDIDKSAPSQVTAGNQLTYTITVTNNGPGTASNVVVTDTLPEGVSYAADTDSCVDNGDSTLTCSLGQMLADDSITFQVVVDVAPDLVVDDPDGTVGIVNTATVDSDQADGFLSNNTDGATTIVVDRADLELTKVCKPDAGVPQDAGQEAYCTVSVKNFGPSAARDVEVDELITSAIPFTITDLSPGCGDVAATQGRRVTCDLGDMDAGETSTVTVWFTSLQSGPINDIATVDAATPDPDTDDNTDEGTVLFRTVADLEVTKSDSPDPVVAGQDVTYTITLTNHGPSTANGVVVSDGLPDTVSIVSVTADPPATCNAGEPGTSTAPTTCNFGNVPSGGVRTMTIVVTVDPDATGQITNDVVVTSTTHDPDTENNTDTTTTTIEAIADLSVTKTDEPDPVVAGEELSYSLLVANAGPSTAYDVLLEDLLPDDVSVVDIEVLGGTADCTVIEAPPLSVRCDIGDLDAGDSLTIVVHVLVDASVPDGAVLVNEVTVTTTSTDPDPSNNTDSTDTDVLAEADLAIDKVVNFETGNASTTIIYTVTVDNLGPSDAQDVSVLDQLPSVLTGGGNEKVVFVFATDGCTYDATVPHTVTCDAGTLPAGESVSWDIHIQVKGSVGNIVNVATVSSSTTDPVSSNDVIAKTVTVSGGSDRPGGPGGGRGKPG